MSTAEILQNLRAYQGKEDEVMGDMANVAFGRAADLIEELGASLTQHHDVLKRLLGSTVDGGEATSAAIEEARALVSAPEGEMPAGMTTTTLTLTSSTPGSLDVRLSFRPSAPTHGPLSGDQAAGLVAMKAVKAWSTGEGGE